MLAGPGCHNPMLAPLFLLALVNSKLHVFGFGGYRKAQLARSKRFHLHSTLANGGFVEEGPATHELPIKPL